MPTTESATPPDPAPAPPAAEPPAAPATRPAPAAPAAPAPGRPVELRVLTGPNLYFTRPAVKLVLDITPFLDLDAAVGTALSRSLLTTSGRPGAPGSTARVAFAARLATALTRRIARAVGRGVPAVHRPGPEDGQVTVAFPWVRRGRGEALARAVAAELPGLAVADVGQVAAAVEGAVTRGAEAVLAADPGERRPHVVPRVPTVAVTGTNGKTTTTRLIAHLARTAGRTPGWSNTDGIVVDGEVVETGDWSGPGGAARVLGDPRVTFAVLETARGGILLRGVGTATNDVSVVTNISADHLGLHGIRTLDQLAEVKATIVRITRPTGWAVLNAEDERVVAMRSLTRARPWLFSVDPTNPHLADALGVDGRVTTVVDGEIVVQRRGLDPVVVVPVDEVPLTLGGLSRVNLANALAGTSAALAAGLDPGAVAEGLRTFAPDPDRNPGRLNVYDLDGRTVVVDLAHNEASLEALLAVGSGLRADGRRLAVVLGTAGDRPDEAVHAMGAMAARAADRVVVAEKEKYRRDRKVGELATLFKGGAAEEGLVDVPVTPTELDGVRVALEGTGDGDVVAVMCQAERAEIDAWLREQGGRPLPAEETAERVHRARA